MERERARRRLSFKLQLRVNWQDILKCLPDIQVVGEPKRVYSSLMKGYESMKVVIPSRN